MKTSVDTADEYDFLDGYCGRSVTMYINDGVVHRSICVNTTTSGLISLSVNSGDIAYLRVPCEPVFEASDVASFFETLFCTIAKIVEEAK